MTRVLVVGGGLAGCLAALAARRAGAEVALVWRSPGATALSTGALDLALPPEMAPYHPLARLGLAALGGALDEAAAELRTGLALEGSWRESGLYSDVHGLPRPASLVPAAVAPGELGRLREARARVAVVGFDAVSEYDPEATAEALRELSGIDAFPHWVRAQLPPAASLTDLHGRRAPEVKARAEAVAFPPGLAGLPPRGFELLSTVPSPRGWALHEGLHRMLGGAGVEVRRAEVHGFAGAGGILTEAVLESDRLPADQFVLAGGHFIGGGLRKTRATWEPLLGLGVFHGGRPVAHDRRLPHLEYLDPAPALESGLLTDADLRPLDGEGRPAYQNLRAAGAILGGWDASAGSAVPVLTGWLAGRKAAS